MKKNKNNVKQKNALRWCSSLYQVSVRPYCCHPVFCFFGNQNEVPYVALNLGTNKRAGTTVTAAIIRRNHHSCSSYIYIRICATQRGLNKKIEAGQPPSRCRSQCYYCTAVHQCCLILRIVMCFH